MPKFAAISLGTTPCVPGYPQAHGGLSKPMEHVPMANEQQDPRRQHQQGNPQQGGQHKPGQQQQGGQGKPGEQHQGGQHKPGQGGQHSGGQGGQHSGGGGGGMNR